jgi:DNA-binding XRE family transcriptional regulator
MKRTTRNRRLSAAEAKEYDAVRKEIEREKPQIDARIRKQMADKRRASSHDGEPTLGQRIRSMRESTGQSQLNLAAAAGISQGYLSQLESDEREPTISIAARLAQALEVSLDELATGVA